MGELSTSLSRVSDYIADTEDSKKVQIKMMGQLIKMLDAGTKR